MTIDWGYIATGTIGFAIGLLLKTLLDFDLAIFIIRYLYWLPVRWLFRSTPNNVSGLWEQVWDFNSSSNFPKEIDRHSNVNFRQFGKYFYGEFHSKGKTYSMKGQIKSDFLYGDWFDKNDELGYFGAFELRFVDSTKLVGKWIGHSKSSHDIYGDIWTWNKINAR